MAAKVNWIDYVAGAPSPGVDTVRATDLNALGAEVNTKGTYSKPGSGIPSSDMSAAVQASLALANTALQTAGGVDGGNPSGTVSGSIDGGTP